MHMADVENSTGKAETRIKKLSVNLTPSVRERLDQFARDNRWSVSTAASVLIEHGLDAQDKMTELAGRAGASRPDIDALVREYTRETGKEEDPQ
jgi:hypothetical protein